jgi:hypothetical protein
MKLRTKHRYNEGVTPLQIAACQFPENGPWTPYNFISSADVGAVCNTCTLLIAAVILGTAASAARLHKG